MIPSKLHTCYGFARNVSDRATWRTGALLVRLFVCLVFLCHRCCVGQGAGRAPQPPKEGPPSEFRVPLLTEPVRLADFKDMAPSGELKGKLGKVTGFIQNWPNEGA